MVEGYGILQPRIAPTMPAERESSLFQRISSGPAGIDPYAAAVSDVYQDLFGEGSYTGKGIYDVDAFETALAGRVPEGALLSHDLFEGLLRARGAGDGRRAVRGVPGAVRGGGLAPAPLGPRRLAAPALADPRRGGHGGDAGPASARSAAGRCSTTCAGPCPRPAAYLTLLVAWMLPGGGARGLDQARAPVAGPARAGARSPPTWCRSARASPSASTSARSCGASRWPARMSRSPSRCSPIRPGSWATPSCAPSFRLLVTRRRLLEWVSAAQVKASSSLDLGQVYARMWGAVALGGDRRRGGGLRRAATPGPSPFPFVALWLLSPGGGAVGEPAAPRRAPPTSLAPRGQSSCSAPSRGGAGASSRPSSVAEDHALPPDNFQEDPAPGGGPPHVADQHGALPPLGGVRARPRLDRHARPRRPAERHAGDHGAARALPRPLLQLVRHAGACGRSSRATSRRWTAATSPGIWTWSPPRSGSARARPLVDRRGGRAGSTTRCSSSPRRSGPRRARTADRPTRAARGASTGCAPALVPEPRHGARLGGAAARARRRPPTR